MALPLDRLAHIELAVGRGSRHSIIICEIVLSAGMDEAGFDHAAREELRHLEDAFADVDPDEVEVSTSDGVLRLDLRDGTKIVINSHRAARQIWMAAVATAWHFDPTSDGTWHAAKTGDELRSTLARVVRERIGLDVEV
ncbi:MAG: iron donor protein CyaY [Acidobacteriota bacterium]